MHRMTIVRSHLYVYAVIGGRPTRVLSGLPTLPDGSPPRLVALDDTLSLVVADVPAAIYSPAHSTAGSPIPSGCRDAAPHTMRFPKRSRRGRQ